jgi:predicted nucleotidyltransferase
VTHKLIYKEICEIDIVPFGEIQNEEGEYDWPPDFMRSMNVAGFMEVREETITFKIDEEDLTFSVAPIHAIYFMKIYAWNDRKYKDDKDGRDQGFILANYIEFKYEVLYDEHEDIVNGEDWDIITSCARILGRDIAKLLKNNPKAIQKTILIIENELEDEEHSYLARSLSAGGGFDYNRAYKALQELLKGIRDLHD